MKPVKVITLLAFSILMSAVLVACAAPTPDDSGITPTRPVNQEPLLATSPPDSEGPIELPDGEVQAGQVTIQLAEAPYIKGNVVIAAIANGLEQPIYTADMKTDCSPMTLEKQDDAGNWQAMLNCAMERAPIVVTVEPGQGYLVTLDPNSVHFTSGVPAADPGIDVGTYRLMFSYRRQPGREGEETEVVTTEPFLVIP